VLCTPRRVGPLTYHDFALRVYSRTHPFSIPILLAVAAHKHNIEQAVDQLLQE